MSDPTRPYRQLARNNLLANRRLHRAIAQLQPHEWQALRTGFFPSLCATLNHIYSVDLFYIDALAGGTLGYAAFAEDIPHPDPATLAGAQLALDHRALTLCAQLTPERLSHPIHIHRDTRIQTESMADTLMHLFLHSQHHRGQAHAMLSGTSIPPPQLDEFFMADDAPARANDLTAVGWTETDLRDAGRI
jgi:uncharacterized damage-inducible protein DinB